MKKIVKVLLIILSLSAAGKMNALAEEINPQIQKGIEYHNRSRNPEEKDADKLIEDCLECLEPFTQSNALACAMYGSATNIKAGRISKASPLKSLGLLKKGSKYLDQAVSINPKDESIRLIRLENGIEVSRTSPVKRYKEISKDVDFFIKDGKIKSLSGESKAEAYLYCGFYYLDSGKLDYALKLFEEAERAAPNSECGKKAHKMLEKYSE